MEKRVYKRVKSELSVLIERETNEEILLKSREGASINISASGILIQYGKPLNLNEVIHVKFLKPNSFDFFHGVARVVRVELNTDNSYEIAIQFVEVSEKDMSNLEYYLKLP